MTDSMQIDADTVAAAAVAAAAALKPQLLSRAAEAEKLRRIPEDVAEQLVAAGLFHITAPSRFSGMGLSPSVLWRAAREIGQGCASSAWLVGLNGANLLMLGKFAAAAQEEVFLSGKPPIVPLLTGGVGYDIHVRRSDGGIRLSGSWRYASGIDVASWVGLLVGIPVAGGPEACVVLVPQEAFEIDHDSWHVVGMRGTGSKNIHLPEVFVPEHRWMSWRDLQTGHKHPTCPNTEAIYDLPLNATFAMSVLAPTLGVASGAVETYRDMLRSRVRSGNQQRQIDDLPSQIELGNAAATLDILFDSLLQDTERMLQGVAGGGEIPLEVKACIRTKLAVSARLALSTAQRLYASAGGSLLPQGTRVERSFRDLHAMASHFLLQPNIIGEHFGKLLLDIPLPANARI